MAWTLEFDAAARRNLRKLPMRIGSQIVDKLEEIAKAENPRVRGKAMAGQYSGHWRYRIGDYRAIARIEDKRMVIVVIAVGHRREVYSR